MAGTPQLERFVVYNTLSDDPCVVLAPSGDGSLVVEAVDRRGRELYAKERSDGTPCSIHAGLTGLPRFVAEAVDEGWMNVGDALPNVLQPEAGLEYAQLLSERIGQVSMKQYLNMAEYFNGLRISRDISLQIPQGDNPVKYAERRVA